MSLAPDLAGHRPGDPGYRRVTVSLFAAGVATFVLLYSTQALFTELAADFGLTPAAATLSLSLTTGSLAVTLLVLGPVSDRFGRTPFIHLSLSLASVVALAGALAPSWPALLALRLAEGVALAGLPAVATAYLREELHPSTHARAAGLYIAGTALGGMASRLVTGPVAELAGWRWALATTAGVGAVCALTVRWLLPASRGFVPAEAGLRSAATRARQALSDPALLALYGIGACGVGMFVAVLNATGFRLAAAPFDVGVGAASLVFLVYSIGSAASAAAGRLVESWGRRAMVPLGCGLAALGVLITLPDNLVTLVVGLAVLTVGFFVVHGTASGWVPVRAHAGGVATGQAASLYLFAYYVGSSTLGTLAGHAWSAGRWPAVVVLALGVLAVMTTLALLLRRTRSLLPTPAPVPSAS